MPNAQPEASCGAELAADAVIPELLSTLMAHVAENLGAHARWVGSATPASAAEHDALVGVAAHYRTIAQAAARAAAAMRGLVALEPAPHDPTALDRAAFARWMGRKIELQTELARLLLEHAEASRAVLAGMDG
jgi:hypothetical protein